MHDAAGRTDWQALILTLLLPAVVVASLVWLALQPQWDDSPDWAVGLFVLIPFEGVRVIVFSILRDAFADFRTPWHAVKFFLLSLAILAVLCFAFSLYFVGIRDTFVALAQAQTWRVIVPPTLLILADGVIGLFFFRGDPRCQSARFEAISSDAEDWLALSVMRLPFVAAALYALVIWLRSRGVAVPDWVRDPSLEAAREVCLLCAATYFAGKGILIGHAYTAHFNRTGKRLLSAGWIQFVLGKNGEERKKTATNERKAAAKRLAALTGADLA
jgi:hypothetical protein